MLLQDVKRQSSGHRVWCLPGHMQHRLQHCALSLPAAGAALLHHRASGLPGRHLALWNQPCCCALFNCNKGHTEARSGGSARVRVSAHFTLSRFEFGAGTVFP